MRCHTVYNTVDIFVLASQYLSHSVVPDRAAHRCRWFLSMSSCRPHNMQKGLSRRPIRWRCFPRQSCWTVSLKTATDVFLGQSGTWTISFFQCLSLIFCSISSFCRTFIWEDLVVRMEEGWRVFKILTGKPLVSETIPSACYVAYKRTWTETTYNDALLYLEQQ